MDILLWPGRGAQPKRVDVTFSRTQPDESEIAALTKPSTNAGLCRLLSHGLFPRLPDRYRTPGVLLSYLWNTIHPQPTVLAMGSRMVARSCIIALLYYLFRDIPFSMIYFPLFAHFNAMGLQTVNDTRSPFFVTLLAGMAAGATAAVSVNPMDGKCDQSSHVVQPANFDPRIA